MRQRKREGERDIGNKEREEGDIERDRCETGKKEEEETEESKE